jgi:hypothetical protein
VDLVLRGASLRVNLSYIKKVLNLKEGNEYKEGRLKGKEKKRVY